MKRFRYVKPYAGTLASGQPIGRDEVVSLDAQAEKQPHNKRLIDSGALLEQKAKKEDK